MSERVDLFVGSLRGGGAERVCVRVANGLAERGFDVRLVVLSLADAAYADEVDDAVRLVSLGKAHARESPVALARCLRRDPPTVALAFNHEIALILLALRTLLRMEFALLVRNINTLSKVAENQESLWHSRIVLGLATRSFPHMDRVIAQSKGMAEDLVRNYGLDPATITVINNPLPEDIARHAPSTPGEATAGAGGANADGTEAEPGAGDDSDASDGPAEILFVGRLVEQKGLDYLLDAFVGLRAEGRDCRLRILGQGPLEAELRSRAAAAGVEDAVVFEGFVDDVWRYYQAADVTVLSSVYEGFPNVLVESIGLGTPVVAFDCPSGPAEIVVDDVNGYLVDYRDADDLRRKLGRALDRDWDQAAVRATAERYSHERIVDEYASLAAEFCDGRG